MKQINLVTNLHKKTKRNYLKRMLDNKVLCMKEAKKYSKNYWDGDRKFGYGGYKYIPGRWVNVANKIIKKYKLNNSSKILDIGCGKGFLLYEIKKILPGITLYGVDISKYALKSINKLISGKFEYLDLNKKKLPYKSKCFDLVISMACLHNLEIDKLRKIIKEINRVGKKSYIMVESYRNNKELFNLQCWALTCETFFSNKEWKWFLNENNFKGNYEFIYFE